MPALHDILRADVLGIAPELSTLPDIMWVVVLGVANEVKASALGTDADSPTLRLARILLAAHFGVISRRARTGAAGPVTSETAGALRRSYGLVALSGAESGLATTMYGQQYMTILRMTTAHGPRVI